jgi:hypothetical protein
MYPALKCRRLLHATGGGAWRSRLGLCVLPRGLARRRAARTLAEGACPELFRDEMLASSPFQPVGNGKTRGRCDVNLG